MARPSRNNVDYFPFLCKEGKAMYYIETTYGNDGYATWVKLLRELSVANNHYLNLSDKVNLMFLASKCRVSQEVLLNILNDLSDLGEINTELWLEVRVVWNQKFIDHIQDAYSKRNNQCIDILGLRVLLTSLGVLKQPNLRLKGVSNPQSKEEYTKEKDSKEDIIVAIATVQKTFEERETEFMNECSPFVSEYSKETVRAFFDYWSEKNKSGKKMKFEMQQTFEISKRLAAWKRREKPDSGFKVNGANNPSRTNDRFTHNQSEVEKAKQELRQLDDNEANRTN